jgi:hypothetical protein
MPPDKGVGGSTTKGQGFKKIAKISGLWYINNPHNLIHSI